MGERRMIKEITKYTIMSAIFGLATSTAYTAIDQFNKGEWKLGLPLLIFSIILWGFLLYLIKDEVKQEVKKDILEELKKLV